MGDVRAVHLCRQTAVTSDEAETRQNKTPAPNKRRRTVAGWEKVNNLTNNLLYLADSVRHWTGDIFRNYIVHVLPVNCCCFDTAIAKLSTKALRQAGVSSGTDTELQVTVVNTFYPVCGSMIKTVTSAEFHNSQKADYRLEWMETFWSSRQLF